MILGPVLTIGGLIALFLLLGKGFTLGALGTFGLVAVALVLWRASVLFGPHKVCWRCKGAGHVGGLLGGRRKCPSCDGGLRKRVGSK